MKQTKLMKMLFVPAALSFFAACSSDNDIVGDKNLTEDKGVTLTINATAGADAAMSRVQYNNDYSVEWTSADKVYAFLVLQLMLVFVELLLQQISTMQNLQ